MAKDNVVVRPSSKPGQYDIWVNRQYSGTAVVEGGKITWPKGLSAEHRAAVARSIKMDGNPPPKLLTLYHVTLEKNVPSIRKRGIRAQKKAMWVGAYGQRLAPEDAIFAFDNFDDAGRWAFKTQYDMKEPVVVLEFQDDSPLWQPDPHWQAGLSKGQWLTRREWAQGYPAVVRPSQIHGIITLDQPMIKALIKTLGEPKQVNKFGKIVKWSRG